MKRDHRSGLVPGHAPRLHFDIGLDSPPSQRLMRRSSVNHHIRNTLLHPMRSEGYSPLLGKVTSVTLGRGFCVAPMDHHHPLPMRYTFKNDHRPSPLMFAYVLQGKRCYEMKNRRTRVVTRAGTWYAGFIPGGRGEGVLMGAPRIRSVKFIFDPLALYDLLEGEVDGLPNPLASLLKRLEGEIMTIGGRMSPAMLAAAEGLLQCPCRTPLQRVKFESRVLDLLGLHLQEIHDGTPASGGRQCSGRQKHLAVEARNALITNLEKPPGLDSMASGLGVSGLTLKKAFERAFGVSLHRYLQVSRMEKGRRLLEQGELNVNEVAGQIGYANVSRFIDAFFRNYGVKPGEFMRQHRRSFAAYPRKTG